MAKKRKHATRCMTREPALPRVRIVGHCCYALEDLDHLDRIRRELFEADAARFKEGLCAGKDNVTDAFVYWIGYPLYLDLVGHDWRDENRRKAAYYALNRVHAQATEVLMLEAVECGLDPHPLYECARVVREIYAEAPQKYYHPDSCNNWPEYLWPSCMGDARYSLPAGQQEALRAGEAVFVRLAYKTRLTKNEDIEEIVRKVTESLLTRGSGIPNDPITLDQFMLKYCEARTKNLRRSRRQALLGAARNKTVKLPPLAYPHKSGQSNTYFAHDLLNAWQSYQDENLDLPPLLPQYRTNAKPDRTA